MQRARVSGNARSSSYCGACSRHAGHRRVRAGKKNGSQSMM
ncbi:hypothetical protein SALB1_3625 [Salinisphaera sp. LB1]|nr:hypothetical protein SALB1_3625 [Salinisphaera sp. LB1]